MTFRLACGDVMPGCSAQFESEDRDALMAEVARHATQVHGITEITPEMVARIDDEVEHVA